MKPIAKKILTVFILGALAVPVYALAEVTTTTTTSTTTTRIADNVVFEELTLGDFQRLVTKPMVAWDHYRQYKGQLTHPLPSAHINDFKMRVESRPLTLDDFRGPGIGEGEAQARYSDYISNRRNAADIDYVYVTRPDLK